MESVVNRREGAPTLAFVCRSPSHEPTYLNTVVQWDPDDQRWKTSDARSWPARGPRDASGFPSRTGRRSTDARKRRSGLGPNGGPLALRCGKCASHVLIAAANFQQVCEVVFAIARVDPDRPGVSAVPLAALRAILDPRSGVLPR